MKKNIIMLALLVLFIVSSISAISAADNVTNDLGIDESYDLSTEDFETHPVSNENLLSNSNFESESVLNADACHPTVPELNQDDVTVPCSSFNSSIIVNKNWEGNYSGNITSIEIQLLHKVEVKSNCPPKWKASPDDPIFDETVGTIVVLPDKNGNLVSYTIVQTATISKENNWRHVFKNLTFYSATLKESLTTGDKYWYLGDGEEYVVREINIQNNVEFISAILVNNFTCPVDGGLKVFWNLTNKIIPPANETNKTNETKTNQTNETTNETNKTDLVNETLENETFNDYAKGPDDVPSENPSQNQTVDKQENDFDVSKNATGNPLFLLLIVLLMFISPVLRKKD